VLEEESVSRRLLLASTSRYRQALLQRIDVPFDVAAPLFDESAMEDRFAALDDGAFALLLAEGKARSLADSHREHLILAADQIMTTASPRTLLHKPSIEQAAVEQLMRLRGGTHTLTTGVVLLEPATDRCERAVDQTRLTMRTYERAEVEAYVATHAPTDCVGAFRIEDAGIRLFAAIEGGDVTGIMGLPLLVVCDLLRRFGVIP
jgi:septum formation protein